MSLTWLHLVPDDDLETLWTVLYLGADSPGVLPVWSDKAVLLWEAVDREIQHRRAQSNPSEPAVP